MGKKDNDFAQAKVRIDSALGRLRDELHSIQEQDLSLFGQLMKIHHSIILLSRYGGPHRSSGSLSASWNPSSISWSNRKLTHTPLSRVHSEPVHHNEESEEESDEDDDEFDNNFGTSDYLGGSLIEFHKSTDGLLLTPDIRPTTTHPLLSFPSISEHAEETHATSSASIANDGHIDDTQSKQISEDKRTCESTEKPDVSKCRKRYSAPVYNVSYATMLKQNSQLWGDVQREQREKGTVDSRKLVALQLAL